LSVIQNVQLSRTSFFFTGKSDPPTASVIRVANGSTEQQVVPQLEVAKSHVNSDEKHVSSEPESNSAPMVRVGGVIVMAGKSAARRTRGRPAGKGGRLGKLPPDGSLYNSTGRPQIIRVTTNNKEYRILDTYEVLAYLTASNAVATFVATYFTGSSLGQFSSLAAVFDQYKIEMIEVWLTPRMSAANGIALNFGQLHSVIDYDDATALTTIASALDYENCVFSSGDAGHYRRFVPHVAYATYSGAFNSYGNVAAPWIDAASSTVQHYGLKTAWTVCDSAYIYDAQFRLHMVWRNAR